MFSLPGTCVATNQSPMSMSPLRGRGFYPAYLVAVMTIFWGKFSFATIKHIISICEKFNSK